MVKAPGAILDLGVGWGSWLTQSDLSAIDTSTWTSNDGITVANPIINGTDVQCLVSGGTAGTDYLLENRITSGVLADVRSIRIKVG